MCVFRWSLEEQKCQLRRKRRKKQFIWSDDEVELLLNIANNYKTSKAAKSVDWESVK